jgi:hypothetical protein
VEAARSQPRVFVDLEVCWKVPDKFTAGDADVALECQNRVFDLAVPVQQGNERKQLSILLLTPHCFQSSHSSVSKRIDALANADNIGYLLVMLVNETEDCSCDSGLHAFTNLQIL